MSGIDSVLIIAWALKVVGIVVVLKEMLSKSKNDIVNEVGRSIYPCLLFSQRLLRRFVSCDD